MSFDPKSLLRALATRLSALLMVAVILLPTQQALAKARYFCHMRNAVSADCCCGNQEHATHDEHASELRAVSCCEKVKAHGNLAPVVRVAEQSALPDLGEIAPPALTPLMPQFGNRVIAPPKRATAPPGQGPPLFLRHCSLLT
jgi:hypothetical protein